MRPVRVNRKAADRIAWGHPWIFATDVVVCEGAARGVAVFVLDPKDRPLEDVRRAFDDLDAGKLARGVLTFN